MTQGLQPSPFTPRPFDVPPPSRDAIYAVLTPPGEAAIATILLDGDRTLARLKGVFRSKQEPSFRTPGQLVLGRVVGAQGELVDEAIAAPVAPEKSGTALEQVELSCHGGVGACEGVVKALEAAGFRAARPGELLARGHRAGRLSLPAIEARLRLSVAATARQAEFLLAHAVFQERWERLGLAAALGARQRQIEWREGLFRAAAEARAQAAPGRRLLKSHRVVLAGPVNAGKSTLGNRLLRSDESIVSPVPGTTRDRLERPAELRGLAVLLSDTAGLREVAGEVGEAEIEREGQARARAAAGSADVVLIVVDGSRAPSEAECEQAEALAAGNSGTDQTSGLSPNSPRRVLLVLNKADLGTNAEAEGLSFALAAAPVRVSALTGGGLGELEAAIETALLGPGAPEAGAPFTARQVRHVAALHAGLQEALDATEVIGHIRALVGTRPNEAELGAVFREFGEDCGTA